MAMPEQSDELDRDFSRTATWGDVEGVRLSIETRLTTEVAELKGQVADVQVQVAEVRAETKAEIAEARALGGEGVFSRRPGRG